MGRVAVMSCPYLSRHMNRLGKHVTTLPLTERCCGRMIEDVKSAISPSNFKDVGDRRSREPIKA